MFALEVLESHKGETSFINYIIDDCINTTPKYGLNATSNMVNLVVLMHII